MSEFEIKAFMVPIFAMRVRSGTGQTTVEVNSACRVHIAYDAVAAEHAGMAEAEKKWPVADGWISHHATALPFTREIMIELLEVFPDLAANADFDKPPEVVM